MKSTCLLILAMACSALAQPCAPVQLLSTGIEATEPIVTSGDLALTGGPAGTLMLDVADPFAPQLLASVPLRGPRALHREAAYIAASGMVNLLDLSDPAHPQPLDPVPGPQLPNSAVVGDDLLCVAGHPPEIAIFDVSNPLQPQRVGTHAPMEEARLVGLADRMLYAIRGDELFAIDLRVPAAPQEIGAVRDSRLVGAVGVIREDNAYFSKYFDSLGGLIFFTAFDLSDPTAPTFLGGATSHGQYDSIAVTRNIALVDRAVVATTPVRGPRIIGPWRPEGAHWSAVGEAILVTGGTLKVYDVSSCSAPCYADCDQSGSLDIFDFLCFQDAFARGDPLADCDSSNGPGVLDLLDLLCFQDEFIAACN